MAASGWVTRFQFSTLATSGEECQWRRRSSPNEGRGLRHGAVDMPKPSVKGGHSSVEWIEGG